jgi:16S rRNA processing protein RimM
MLWVIESDQPEEYSKLESVFVEIKQKLVPFFIDHIRLNGDKAIVRIEGITDIEQVEGLKGKQLYLPLTELPKLNDDQYYFHEIIGFKVEDKANGILGEVINIYDVNGNDLMAVDHQGREVLIPLKDEIVSKVDKTNKKIEVDLPVGLLDIYLKP